jgi:hypothetical protein
LPKFQISHAKSESKVLGQNLSLEIKSPDLKLSDSFPHLTAILKIPKAEMTSLTYLNAFLPKSSPVGFTHGKGILQGQLFVSNIEKEKDEGNFSLVAQSVEFQKGKSRIAGDLNAQLKLKLGDMTSGKFNISDSVFTLQKGKWEGKCTLENSIVHLSPPHSIKGTIHLRATDAKPLLSFVSSEGEMPDFIQNKLSFTNLIFRTAFLVTDSQFTLNQSILSGDDSTAVGWFKDNSGRKLGRVLVQVGALTAGAEVKNDSTHLILQNVSHWYHDNLP